MNEPRMEIKEINISTFKGFIPAGNDLVVFEKGDEGTALVLYGFDEVGLFDHEFKNPTYGIATNDVLCIEQAERKE